MPFTPYHFGPGLAVKAAAPRYFSLSVFVFSQVLIDLEPLYFMLTGEWPVHRFFHTCLGATVIAAVSYVPGGPLCGLCLAIFRRDFGFRMSDVLAAMKMITPTAALSAAIIGSYSHVALDSIMHGDTHPLAPFSDANPLLHSISVAELHLYCIVAGLAGLIGMGFWWLVRQDRR